LVLIGYFKNKSIILLCHCNPGGVLWISSDGDERMGAKIKTQKNP